MANRKKNNAAVAAGVVGIAAVPLAIWYLTKDKAGADDEQAVLTVRAFDVSNVEITSGMNAVLYLNNEEVARGPVPAQFTVSQGSTFSVEIVPDNPGDFEFIGWDDGVAVARRTVKVDEDIQIGAIFNEIDIPPPPVTDTTISVESVDQAGTPIQGLFTVLSDQAGNQLSTGFTPVSFDVDVGSQYVIQVQDFGQFSFDRWADSGSTDMNRTILATESPITLRAVYNTSTTPPPGEENPISAVTVQYWHHIPYGLAQECRVIVSYDAQGIAGQTIFGKIEAEDMSGNSLGSSTVEFTGKDFDNLPLWKNVPTGTPTAKIRFWFQNTSGDVISPVTELTLDNNTTSKTLRPPSPTSSEMTVRYISGHYTPLSSGLYQFQVVLTYRAPSIMIGRSVRPVMELRAHGSSTILKDSHGFIRDAFEENAMIIKTGTDDIGDPDSIDVTVYIVDSETEEIISTKDTFIDFDQDGIFP